MLQFLFCVVRVLQASSFVTHLSILAQTWCAIVGTTPCDLKLEGADKLLKTLDGGLDGTYAVWSCENGRPLYKREKSPVGRESS